MRLGQFYESMDPGTFIGVRLSSESRAAITKWLQQNHVDEPTEPDDLHVTLIYSRKHIDHKPISYHPPIVIDPDSYKIELFGDNQNVLVLTFSAPLLERRERALRDRYGVTLDYDEYRPHITLTTHSQVVTGPLEPPPFSITLTHEYVEELDE